MKQRTPGRCRGCVEDLAHDGVTECVRAIAGFEQAETHADVEVFQQANRVHSEHGREDVDVDGGAENRRAGQGPRCRAGFRATLKHCGLNRFRWGGAFGARRQLGEKECVAAAALVQAGGLRFSDDLARRIQRQRREPDVCRLGQYVVPVTCAAGEQQQHR